MAAHDEANPKQDDRMRDFDLVDASIGEGFTGVATAGTDVVDDPRRLTSAKAGAVRTTLTRDDDAKAPAPDAILETYDVPDEETECGDGDVRGVQMPKALERAVVPETAARARTDVEAKADLCSKYWVLLRECGLDCAGQEQRVTDIMAMLCERYADVDALIRIRVAFAHLSAELITGQAIDEKTLVAVVREDNSVGALRYYCYKGWKANAGAFTEHEARLLFSWFTFFRCRYADRAADDRGGRLHDLIFPMEPRLVSTAARPTLPYQYTTPRFWFFVTIGQVKKLARGLSSTLAARGLLDQRDLVERVLHQNLVVTDSVHCSGDDSEDCPHIRVAVNGEVMHVYVSECSRRDTGAVKICRRYFSATKITRKPKSAKNTGGPGKKTQSTTTDGGSSTKQHGKEAISTDLPVDAQRLRAVELEQPVNDGAARRSAARTRREKRDRASAEA